MPIPATIIGPDEPDTIGGDKPSVGTTEQPRPVEPNSRPSGIPTIDPFKIRDAGNDSGKPADGNSTGKRRGRPPGSRNKGPDSIDEKTKVSGDLASLDIESLLVSTHYMCAKYFEAPEWELEKDEAKEGAQYLQKISKHYNHNVNPVALLWVGFIFWLLTTYGTRAMATYSRLNESPREKKGPQLVPQAPPKNSNQPAAPSEKVDLSTLAPSQLWNEAPE